MLPFNTNGFIIFDLPVINNSAVCIPKQQSADTVSGFNNIVK